MDKVLVISRKINPLLVIRSPKDWKPNIESYAKIDFIDKLWLKNFPLESANSIMINFVINHPKYTHIIICSGDVTFDEKPWIILLKDLLEHDYPVLSGCCNYCDRNWKAKGICRYCKEGENHPHINITFDPIRLDTKLTRDSYNFVSEGWRRRNPVIKQVWFQGFAPAIIRKDVFIKVGFKSLVGYVIRGAEWMRKFEADDLMFAICCSLLGYSQFCDFRAFIRHHGLVGGRSAKPQKTSVIFEGKKRKLEDVIQ